MSLFNEKVKKEYEGKKLVFDLARVDFTYPDGRPASFQKDGRNYPPLVS